MINFDKSSCFFLRNVPGRSRAIIKNCLGMRELDKKAKYLGIPLFIEKNKMAALEDLKRKVDARFHG